MSSIEAGLGLHAMWGFTPALDLLEDTSACADEEVNILLCQPADVGHILKTIACRRRHLQWQRVNIYVWDKPVEVLARHLLLLQIALDRDIPMRQRANIFLEVYGNALVQERTSKYIERMGRELVKLVCNQTGALAHLVDLSLLKFRDRDMLEAVLKSWGHGVLCDVEGLRDFRLRHFYGARYDSRQNVSDWDYIGQLKEVASIIHYKQYQGWRLRGVAYEFGDQVYDQPNRTMASFAEGVMKKGEHRGQKKEVRGFYLDIRAGPYIPFGVDCDKPNEHAEGLFEVHNKGTGTEQHRHSTAEVAVYNLLSYFWELESGTRYLMSKAHDVYSGLGEDAAPSDESPAARPPTHNAPPLEAALSGSGTDLSDCGAAEASNATQGPTDDKNGGGNQGGAQVAGQAAPLESAAAASASDPNGQQSIQDGLPEGLAGIKIYLLTGDFSQYATKTRFRHLFDRVVVSSMSAQLLGEDTFNELLAHSATVTVDTARYLVPLSKEQRRGFVARVCTMANEQGWSPLFDASYDANGPAMPDERIINSADTMSFHHSRPMT